MKLQAFYIEYININMASVGPRLFSRGNGRGPGRGPGNSGGFNGATTFQPWK